MLSAVCRLVGRVQAASCKVKVNSFIVELLLSYHNDGTVYFAKTTPSLHSYSQPANCNIRTSSNWPITTMPRVFCICNLTINLQSSVTTFWVKSHDDHLDKVGPR